ncbi:MAG TPA: formylglycine-generating enzyme family protein [Solirubrobacterales bacterium]|nr:formylglycine-generating enzyme family protein [Solirubrobacterales bacterium]
MAANAEDTSRRGMTWVSGGPFRMGCDRFYPEEQPIHTVDVDGFWIDSHPVTVREFRHFVRDTGHVTVAERKPDPAYYPGVDPALLVPGSLVFKGTPGPVPLTDYRAWWAFVPGACWRRPEGPGSDVRGRDRHPVVHIANEDAAAYAEWVGKELPTEAEWEFAARGGLDGAIFTWGDDDHDGERPLANTWQGRFPWENLGAAGYRGTSKVGVFPPNGYGLFDMVGNVWEWTSDFFSPRHPNEAASSCCVPSNPRVSSPDGSYDRNAPDAHIPRKVIKGGSHLCAPSYCLRYRPAARQGEALDSSTGHIGFRCLVRAG